MPLLCYTSLGLTSCNKNIKANQLEIRRRNRRVKKRKTEINYYFMLSHSQFNKTVVCKICKSGSKRSLTSSKEVILYVGEQPNTKTELNHFTKKG